MTTVKPYLGPCTNSENGANNRSRYEDLNLPEEWIANRFAHGICRWIGPDEYFWTPDSYFEVCDGMTPKLLHEIRKKTSGCYYKLSLPEQCALLGVPYHKMHPADMVEACADPFLDLSRGVEEFSFDFYKKQGWAGDSGEGASIHLLSFVLKKRLDARQLKYHGYYYSKLNQQLYPHGVYTRDRIQVAELDIIEHEIGVLLEFSGLLEAYELWHKHHRSFGLPRKVNPDNLPLDDFLAVCEGLSKPFFASFVNLQILGYGGMGWPDLTLQRDAKLKFVEVKQSQDKFTRGQAYWIRNFALPLGLDFKVLHVAPSLKVGLKTRTVKITK